jgi:hypothetical protein
MESAAISTKRRKQETTIRYQHNAHQTKNGRKCPAKIVSHCTGNSVSSEDGEVNKDLLMLEPMLFLVFLLQLNLSSGNWYTNKMRKSPLMALEYEDVTMGAMGMIPPALLDYNI